MARSAGEVFSARCRPPSNTQPPNSAPSATQQPKGGGSLVSTHAALSPELGSRLKARSGCKSRTTAPGVQGAGRGPRRFLWLLSCPRKKVTRLSGRDPTTSPAGCRKIPGGETPQTPPPPPRSSLKAAAAWSPPTPFFFHDTATTVIYALALRFALPLLGSRGPAEAPWQLLWLLSGLHKKGPRLSGRDPTTPPAGCRKILRRGNPSQNYRREPGNSKRKKLEGDPAGRPQAANTKLGPPLAPAGPPPHRGGRLPPGQVELGGALGAFLL